MKDEGIRYCLVRKPGKPEELAEEVFKRLSDAIADEPALLTTTPEHLRWSYEDGLAVIAFDGDEPVGYTRIHPILASGHSEGAWYELGTTLVLKSHRGLGINQHMYHLLLPEHADKNILATTITGASLVVGHQMGFVMVPRRALPEPVWKASCTCPLSKTKSSTGESDGCILAHDEAQQDGQVSCFFRVTAETAARHGLSAHH